MPEHDPTKRYLTKGLIAYIGNKRSLLPFLSGAFVRCAAGLELSGPLRFLDPFAGSGGVSRVARTLGYAVASNDIEYYAAVIARCRVVMDPGRLEAAFSGEGGSARAFSALDAFARRAPAAAFALVGAMPDAATRACWLAAFDAAAAAPPYIARHYAPASTDAADWRSERLFYTAENARFLDRAREAVERRYPVDPLDPSAEPALRDAKAALLDALLYEAATRVNTSGVFKACHRGFGGHGRDALSRIASPMRLAPPDLVDGPCAEVAAEDAVSFCARRPADIAYLDPPYNQHQYGSNYHLLTTIARWDKPPVSDERDGTGFLLDRSGIRPDWVATRSDFCGRHRAAPAFASLLDSIDARYVLVSYNEGGILAPDELRTMLASRGEVRVEAVPYVAYRGGKQSATRAERTSEFLFVLDSSRPASETAAAVSERQFRRIRLLGALDKLKKARFRPGTLSVEGLAAEVRIGDDGRLYLDDSALATETTDRLELLAESLRQTACSSNVEAFDVIFPLFRAAATREAAAGGRDTARLGRDTARLGRDTARLGRDALSHLRKIAFRKYAAEYRPRSLALRAACGTSAAERFLRALDDLDARAALRGVRVD